MYKPIYRIIHILFWHNPVDGVYMEFDMFVFDQSATINISIPRAR